MRPSLMKSTAELLRRSRGYASSAIPERYMAILGTAGGIGQPLSLLMKLNPLVSSLSLYDIAVTPGVAADVYHINSPTLVKGFMGDDKLGEALEGSDVVIIPTGVPRKPGMTRDDLFNINAGIVKWLCTAIAKHCPNDLPFKPKYFVTFTVTVEQKENVNKAVKKFSDNFAILLFHSDGRVSEWDEFEWSQRAIHISVRKQTKWWYAKRFLHPEIV